jgi:hypothetical protein
VFHNKRYSVKSDGHQLNYSFRIPLCHRVQHLVHYHDTVLYVPLWPVSATRIRPANFLDEIYSFLFIAILMDMLRTNCQSSSYYFIHGIF